MNTNVLNPFEKLGVFYLGKKADPVSGKILSDYLLYDSADFTTHAVCVGMTGSGKTGLCISILEEAAIDNIPSIIIDPKGDMGNLLLTFPQFRGADFLPWINPGEAQKKGLDPESFAEQQAALWKNGLAEWDQDTARVQRFRDSCEFTIYTPGNTAGIPVSIVDSLAAPRGQKLEDVDLLRERIQTTVSGLLGLLGLSTDPLQSNEHILLSTVIEHSWLSGIDLQLGDLIHLVQKPPLQQVGVFNIEDFLPTAARTKLAMALNNLLAAPTFKTWLEGRPLDIDQILYTKDGKPCTAVFSIAHLSDPERMFFVTLLLNQVIGWMRTRTGSMSLRALLYMDEVFGFLPPVGEPPSKKPLLTLLKQARAFGLGVILSTQNPVDLDYKGLSNAGTWFIGRLQTEKDKERLVDGLVRGDSAGVFDKQKVLETISSLNKRQFLLHNVHENQPQIFNTRWVLSYLAGPLTRNQIAGLMKNRQEEKYDAISHEEISHTPGQPNGQSALPQFPAGIRNYYAQISSDLISAERIFYHPYLLAVADVSVYSSRYSVAHTETAARALSITSENENISWVNAFAIPFSNDIVGGMPAEDAVFLSPAPVTSRIGFFDQLDKQFENYLYQSYILVLLHNQELNMVSGPDELQRDFLIRLRESAHQKRELEKERMQRAFEKKLQHLENRIQTAQSVISRENDQYRERILDTAISVGSSLLGAFLGGRSGPTGVTRAARSASKIRREKQDVDRARQNMEQLQNEFADLNRQFDQQIGDLAQKYEKIIDNIREIQLRPRRTDIVQKFLSVVWVPFQKDPRGQLLVINRSFLQQNQSGKESNSSYQPI